MVKSVSTARDQLSQPCRKLLQMRPNVKAQHKKQKLSTAKSLLDYLTSDSFMYGPLLSPPTRPDLPHNNGGRDDVFPDRSPILSHDEAKDAGGSMVTGSNTLKRSSSTLHRMGTLTRRLLWKLSANRDKIGNEGVPTASELLRKCGEEPVERSSPVNDSKKMADENEGNGDGNLTDVAGDDDESSKSFTESHTENDVTPLQKEAAMEVTRRLVRKVGGRLSKELGIFVDIHDSQAERWFLATTFLNQPSDIEPAKHMLKKLQSMRISKIQDVLGIDQSELEEACQSVMHNQRIASRLHRIALGLHSLHGGGICTLKRRLDYTELKRDVESLPGYSKSAARIFLREMRNVWPGASPEFEIRTRNAAKHLHLLASIKDGAESTSTLLHMAQDAGLDERDLEVALVKLSYLHARQYRSCPGGRECEFARITLSNLEHLIVKV